MSNDSKKTLKSLEKINIKKYSKMKVSDLFPIFNSVLILNIIIIGVSIGIIIAKFL
ncbi:hypothetical protein J2Z62_000187 [Mycoplasmoides fastidiosum]|uniref:Uncharacterized protein n=1 Tax=Mycoplasmoides fastidiosum TaxID=92758 RepID=A0ABU0LYI4_9BACT|nr:hypothetical protein [Mycoplasmoides fastidiosum]